ncbi:MAG: hypothetical protein AABY22_16460, partial [Nanoarchaeota archaeon]
HFVSIEFIMPKELKLKNRVLEKPMLDKDILAKWKPKETTLGEFAWAIKNHEKAKLLKNDYTNIFYIRDNDNTLWAVRARWDSFNRYWFVGAYSVGYPSGWAARNQVLSQAFNSGNLENLDSGNLEKRVRELEQDMKKIKNLFK